MNYANKKINEDQPNQMGKVSTYVLVYLVRGGNSFFRFYYDRKRVAELIDLGVLEGGEVFIIGIFVFILKLIQNRFNR